MRVLIIGGAGRVGSTFRPALEAEHDCRYLDLKPVPGAEDRTTVGDVNDDETVRAALDGIDTVVYATLGIGQPYSYVQGSHTNEDPNAAFDVNTKGLYRVLFHGLELGVRRFVQASTMSIYHRDGRPFPATELRPTDSWRPYGVSKWLAEELCAAACVRCPDATIVALRMMWPTPDAEWERVKKKRDKRSEFHPVGPNDLRRLYAAAVRCDKPGFHVMQTSGDVSGTDIPHDRAKALLGWAPRGE